MKMFEPSSEKLNAMIDAAMAKCDAHRDQLRRAQEERENDRYARGWIAEVKARRYRVSGVISNAF